MFDRGDFEPVPQPADLSVLIKSEMLRVAIGVVERIVAVAFGLFGVVAPLQVLAPGKMPLIERVLAAPSASKVVCFVEFVANLGVFVDLIDAPITNELVAVLLAMFALPA